jgi:hypothetical protein
MRPEMSAPKSLPEIRANFERYATPPMAVLRTDTGAARFQRANPALFVTPVRSGENCQVRATVELHGPRGEPDGVRLRFFVFRIWLYGISPFAFSAKTHRHPDIHPRRDTVFPQDERSLVQVNLNCDSVLGISAVIQVVPIVGGNDIYIIVVVPIV